MRQCTVPQFATMLGIFIASSVHAQCETHVFAAPDPSVELFGGIVSLHEDRAAISEAAGLMGSLRVFVRSGASWAEEAAIADPNREPYASFGIAFQLTGDTLITSAFESALVAPGEGAVYVFKRTDSGWGLDQEIRPSSPAKFFGYSVAFDDQTLVVGANLTPVPGQAGKGCVFVFSKVNGVWSPLQQIFAPSSPADTYFGKRVFLLGDRLYVSQYPTNVFEYQRSRGGWALTHQFQPVPQSVTLGYAESLAATEDLLVVGGKDSMVRGLSTGNATLYRRAAGRWDDGQILAPPTDEGPVFFAGAACAIAGDKVLVGAPLSSGGASHSGRVFVYTENDGGWGLAGEIIPGTTIAEGNLGWSISPYGDEVLIGRSFATVLFAGLGDEDCNGNGAPDACDITDGTSLDLNQNGVPDECEAPGDLNGDGTVGGVDLGILLGDWGPCAGCRSDLNADGSVGADDLAILFSSWTLA
jgi:hypothetical protein